MRRHVLAGLALPHLAGLAVLVASVSCATSPTTPNGSVTVTTATQLAPANGQVIPNLNQPVKLAISNAFVGGGSSNATYTFEVASDSGFKTIVASQNVAADPSGQTTITLGTLPPGADYFWHVRTAAADTTGQFTAAEKFTIGPSITIGQPTPVTPITGANPSVGWPVFTVNDAPHTGPATQMAYTFDISTTASFTSILVTGTVGEQSNQTSFVPAASVAVPIQATLFWRATPKDLASGIVGAPTAGQTFKVAGSQQALIATMEGIVLWPGVQPTGTNGHAVMGDGWNIQGNTSFNGVTHVVPTVDELRVFDLLDRNMDPNLVTGFLNNNGYATDGEYFPDIQVYGFSFEYMTIIGGAWQLVIRAGG